MHTLHGLLDYYEGSAIPASSVILWQPLDQLEPWHHPTTIYFHSRRPPTSSPGGGGGTLLTDEDIQRFGQYMNSDVLWKSDIISLRMRTQPNKRKPSCEVSIINMHTSFPRCQGPQYRLYIAGSLWPIILIDCCFFGKSRDAMILCVTSN